MAGVRRMCTSTVDVRRTTDGGGNGGKNGGTNGDTTGDRPSLPVIGPLAVNNPRFLAVSFGGLGLALALSQ